MSEPRHEPKIPTAMMNALAERRAGIDSQELLTEIVRMWGGAGPLALDFYQEFKSATKGGATRQRILEMLQRLIIQNTEHEKTVTKKPSELTTEELEGLMAEYVRKALGNDKP